MDQRKRARMEPYRAEMDSSAVEYHPFAVSCWGRLHPSATTMLRSLARVKARRTQGEGAEQVYRQLLSRIHALVWRRAARMALRCRPRGGDEEAPAALSLDEATILRAGSPGTLTLPAY